jgi:hypothetical protein
MPHKLYDWRVRVKAAEREYQAVRIALDLLGRATDDDIHDLTEDRGWDDFAATEVYATERNLDATYLIRMYSVFERAVGSFWRQVPGNADRQVDGDEMLDEVGYAQLIDTDAIESAQAVRIHRNNLVHRRIEDHAGAMMVEAASRDLLTYLNRLDATWG